MLRLSLLACIALLAGCSFHEPVGVVLVYEADTTPDPSADAVAVEKLVAAVQRRVRMVGEAQADRDGRIEVRVYGNDPTAVRRRLDQTGVLEFRIVASGRDDRHRDIVALAEKLGPDSEQESAEGSVEVLDEGMAVAKWVKVVESEADQFAKHDDFVSRRDGKGRLEILVMLDEYNVTGKYLASVSPGVDRMGKPCLSFALNAEGAQRFGRFTRANLPDEGADNFSTLAIILDRKVYTAPVLRSRIGDRAEITGNFTAAQTEEMAAVLSAGSLPAPLRLVSERRTKSGE